MANDWLGMLIVLTVLATSAMAADTRPGNEGVGVQREPSGPLTADEVNLLLSLDLDRGGMEKIKAAAGDPQMVAGELLAYYRARTTVKHPAVDRAHRREAKGHYASGEDIKIADEAIRNILITAPELPHYDFGDKIDWFTNRHPTKDPEWIVQLHRQYSWDALGRAYWHTGDEKYAQAYARQLADWLANCPPQKDSIAWRVLEIGIRGHSWTIHFNRFLDSPHYTPELLVRTLNSLYDHAAMLTTGRQYTRNNWGLMEAEGTSYIAITFPEFKDAQTWRKKGIGYLSEQIAKQVLPDGMHAEMCFDYHEGSIDWFQRTLDLAELNGLGSEFPPDYRKTIERMYEVLGLCAHPNGYGTMFGDDRGTDDRRGSGKLIRRGEASFPGAEAMREGAKRFPDNPTLRFLATGEANVKPPTALALSSAGLYSLRSDWSEKAIHLIMKCGPDGGWHCQPDNGTFELSAYGHRLMPDSGCYVYGGDIEGRKWFRRTRVHQTLTLDGNDSAYAASLRLWQPGDGLDAVVVENGSYPDLTHRRAVLFVKKQFFVLVDDAIGKAAGNVDLHFQLAPGKPVFDRGIPSARTDFAAGGNVLVQALPQADMTMDEEEGQVSFAYEKKEPRSALRFRVVKAAQAPAVRFVTLVVPYEGQEPPKASVKVSGVSQSGDSRIELEVSVGATSARVGYDLTEKKAWCK